MSDVVESVNEININVNAMNIIMAYDEDALYSLKSFVQFMDIRRLNIDHCKLDNAAIGCIGKMRGHTGLSMRSNNCPRNLKYLRSMSNLIELDVSGSKLIHADTPKLKVISSRIIRELAQSPCIIEVARLGSKKTQKTISDYSNQVLDSSLPAIGSLENLKSLKMEGRGLEPGSLERIKGLQHIEELDVSMNRLCKGDMMVIGCMKALSRLNIGYCKTEPGSMVYLQNLEMLVDLRIAGNKLKMCDMMVIGNMKGLTALCIRECTWETKSFTNL